MKRGALAGALMALGFSGAAHAQQTISWPAPQTATQQAQVTYFPMGTPLTLVTCTQLSTKTNKPGDRVELYVAQPLSYRGQTVIPTGAVAIGEVGRAERNGHLGKKGKLELHVLSIETASGPVRLGGGARDEGKSGLAASLATVAFVSPLGVLIHGTSAELPVGTYVQAYLAEPLRFHEQPDSPAMLGREAHPDGTTQPLPARFDPNAFGGGARTAAR